MVDSSISLFSEPDDFQAALREIGYRELLMIGPGAFRARMTRIALQHLKLCSTEERLSRVAAHALAPGMVRILLPPATGSVIYGGMRLCDGQILTHGSARIIHERVDGPCRWQAITISARHLSSYSRALTGATIAIPPAIRVRQPRPGALKDLIALHTAATRVTEMRPGEGYGAQAAHGLEQELIDRLVECLTVKPVNADYASACRAADVLARFEHSIEENPHQFPRMAQLCRDLDIAERTLRRCCFGHLGMGPVRYLRLRRMQLVHRALRSAAVKRTTVTQAVRQQGFHEIGRFAGLYRAHYGELPSATLRRSMTE